MRKDMIFMETDETNKTENNQAQLEASFGIALVDALPVICFSISIALIASMYDSAVFLVGALLCIIAGLGKVLWKLILAAAHKDIQLLYRQFHYLMPGGFVLILLSLIISRPSLSELWKNSSSFPCNILFLLAIVGFAVMGILGVKMSASDKRANWIEQLVNLAAQLCILLGVLMIWYASDYYRADAEVTEYLESSGSVEVIEIDNGLYFDGEGEDNAIIFYPGAKVEYSAYAPLMMKLAENGVDCFLLEMPYNMAIFGINRADDVMEEYDYEHWYISGHSLGGAMAASYAVENTGKLDGVILLAAYATKDLGDLAVLSIYGSNDGVLSMEKVEAGREYSTNYTEICIEGGCHAWFGYYGEQDGDGTALISREEQWQQTVDAVLDIF
ncbi:MAG: alpha/beta hydrolase [Lachnospiraceae bacterium]|nr:alpha/beta hydrolase [Lachnospiraceae bacterium]